MADLQVWWLKVGAGGEAGNKPDRSSHGFHVFQTLNRQPSAARLIYSHGAFFFVVHEVSVGV